MKTYDDYLTAAMAYWREHPEQRKGQAFFNALATERMDIADKLWSTDDDPFYVDTRLPAFLYKVRRLLEP